MFAEDVDLLPADSFKTLLRKSVDDPTQEMGDVLRVVLGIFQRLADLGQSPGDIPRHACRLLGWIERLRVGPDLSQPFPNLRVPQFLHEDAEALAVGELVVGATSAGEVSIKFETMSYVAGNYERRCCMIDVEQEDIALGLPARVLHHHVPVASDAASAQLLRLSSRDRKVPWDSILLARQPGLLGLKDEAISIVEVDPLWVLGRLTSTRPDCALEDVVVLLAVGSSGVGARHVQDVAQMI